MTVCVQKIEVLECEGRRRIFDRRQVNVGMGIGDLSINIGGEECFFFMEPDQWCCILSVLLRHTARTIPYHNPKHTEVRLPPGGPASRSGRKIAAAAGNIQQGLPT